jgi:hypothetical protein
VTGIFDFRFSIFDWETERGHDRADNEEEKDNLKSRMCKNEIPIRSCVGSRVAALKYKQKTTKNKRNAE